MSDLSTVDDDDFLEDDNGQGDEGGNTDADEGEGGDSEEGGEDEGEDEGGQGEESLEQPARRGKTSDTVRSLRRRAQEAEAKAERADRLERELEALRRQPQQHQLSQADIERQQREEEDRLALMTPAELMRYTEQRVTARFEQQRQQDRFENFENHDRTSFRAMAASNPLVAKHADRVESLVRERRAAGENVPREVALKFLLGEELLKKASSGSTKERKAARSRVDAATTRSTRSSGGELSERGSRRRGDEGFDDLERRIANEKF